MRRKHFPAIYLPALIMSFSSGLLIPVMPLYATSFEVSYGLVGVILAAKGLGNVIFDVPAGLLTRRWGHKRSMLVGAACFIACHAALAITRDMVLACVCLTFAGMGQSLWGISRHTYVTELIRTEHRGRSIALLGGIARIGMLLGPVVGGLVAASFGLRAPFALFACLACMAAISIAIFVKDSSSGPRDPLERPDRLWAVLKSNLGTLMTAGSGQLCAQLVRTARHIIIPLYATDILGLDVKEVGLIISLSSFADVLMFYPAGLIMDRFGRKWAYIPSFIIQSACMAMIPMTDSFLSLQIVAMLLGLGNGLGSGTMMTLGADLAPERSRGEFLGLWRFIGDGGSVGGPLIVGGVAEFWGLLAAPFAVAGVGFMGVGILALLVPETLRARRLVGC